MLLFKIYKINAKINILFSRKKMIKIGIYGAKGRMGK
ncbi:4-hydroxy-tetrahydrodipicolinate reductase, partial [Campylobacter jejuni]|nr:4-hydroxy-tetrahydrodipicolinate reductase [Campylobacter jejuni]